MTGIFLSVLKMSGSAGLCVLAVLLARLALRRAPKIFSYTLWGVVLFRLLCPVIPESSLSLLPAAQTLPAPGQEAEHVQVVQVQTGLPAVDRPVNDYLAQHPYEAPSGGPAPDRPEFDWSAVLSHVWLAGGAAMLLSGAAALLRLKRGLAEAVPLGDGVWMGDRVPAPFVLGLFRPRIYLPSDLPEEERDYVLLHERTHIRRKDHIFRALAWLALVVHWFNPLIWLAFHLAGRDMEMSCDEAVLRRMGRDVRADYSASLLRLSTGRRLPAGPLAFGDGDPKARIRNVLNYKKPALWVLAAAVLAVAVLCAALATDRQAEWPRLPSPFGQDYQVAEVLFTNPQMDPQLVPERVSLSSTGELSIDGESQGELPEGELDRSNFLYFFGKYSGGDWTGGHDLSGTLRRENSALWESLSRQSAFDQFQCLLQQRDGSLYLASGWYDPERLDYPGIEDTAVSYLVRLEAAPAAPTPEPVPTPSDPLQDAVFSLQENGGVLIEGLDADYLEWDPSGWLRLISPRFLGGLYAQQPSSESAFLPPSSDCELIFQTFIFNGERATSAEQAAASGILLDLMSRVRTWYDAEGPVETPVDALPFEQPLEMEFCSGAGAWSTRLTLHPDGSFEGEYSDADMGENTVYVCQFHGRFGAMAQRTDVSWSMVLEELTLDTGRPIGEEWTEGRTRYVSEGPYGLHGLSTDALEPGAAFVLYAPDMPLSSFGTGWQGYGGFLSWWPALRRYPPYESDDLGCWGLRSMETDCGFFTIAE